MCRVAQELLGKSKPPPRYSVPAATNENGLPHGIETAFYGNGKTQTVAVYAHGRRNVHSQRSAITGSTRVARRAGRNAASAATAINAAGVTM